MSERMDNMKDKDQEQEVNSSNEASTETNEAEIVTEAPISEDEKNPEDVIIELEKQNAELKDQYLRKCADFDNYRKRMIKEKQDAFDYANTNLLTDLIAILDDFDRALLAGKDAKDKDSELKPVVDGIKMINKQMRGLLEAKYNLSSYGEQGDLFNHDLHEAIGSSNGPVAEPVCTEIYLKGYKLKDRVIRFAKVMVQMPDGSVTATDDAGATENK